MRTVLIIVLFLIFARASLAGEGTEVALLRQGTESLELQNYQRAARAFGEAARLDPACVEAHRGLGLAYLKMGSHEAASDPELLGKAAAAFGAALALAHDAAEIHYQLGLVHLALRDKNAALKEYESLQGLDPAAAGRLKARIASYMPPVSYRAEGSPAQASENLTRVTVLGNSVFIPVTLW